MMDKMKNLVVGLTGQTGAGKTTVSDYLKENGITIIDADHIARGGGKRQCLHRRHCVGIRL